MALPAASTVFAPPPGYSGPSYTFAQVESYINTEALKYHVDPRLALAYILNESGGNPYAIGDQGTSFGLAQLHQGGELGSLTPGQAFNPVTNLDVSLSEVQGIEQSRPGLTDPGAIAAAAQRPANQQAYAATVDAIYQSLGGQTIAGTSGGPGAQNAILTAAKSGQQPGAAPQTPSASTGPITGTLTASKGGLAANALSSLDALLNPGGGGGLFSFLNPTTDAKLLLARGAVVAVGFGFGLAGLILLTTAVAGIGTSSSAVNAAVSATGPVGAAAEVAANTVAPKSSAPAPKAPYERAIERAKRNS